MPFLEPRGNAIRGVTNYRALVEFLNGFNSCDAQNIIVINYSVLIRHR